MKLEKCSDQLENKHQCCTSSLLTWIRLIQCINSVLNGIRNFSKRVLRSHEILLNMIETRVFLKNIHLLSIRMHQDHYSKDINFCYLFRCVLNWWFQKANSMLMTGTSSFEEEQFLIEVLKFQNQRLSGSQMLLGITSQNLKRFYLILTQVSVQQSCIHQRIGKDGTVNQDLNNHLCLLSGKLNVKKDSRRWLFLDV